VAHARRSSFPRRRVSWSLGPSGRVAVSASTSNLFPVVSESVIDDLTVVRTRGSFLIHMLTAAAAIDGFQWALGLCNVTQNAAGIGATAIPDPLTDIAWDGWFYHTTGDISTTTSSIVDGSNVTSQRVEIDSKGMRKTHLSDTLVAMLAVTEVGTATAEAYLTTRILDKLP